MANVIKATTLCTDRTAGVIIPSALRHDFTPFLRDMNGELLRAKIKPSFFIRAMPIAEFRNKHATNKIVRKIESTGLDVTVTFGPKPVGLRVRNGFSDATRASDVAFFICDDFDHLVKDLAGFVNKISDGNHVLLGQWDQKSKLYLPYPMILNEEGMSAAVTYLRTEHPSELQPDSQNLEPFIRQAKEIGTWVQVYVGIAGVASNSWGGISARIDQLFVDSKDRLDGVGTEVGIPLAAYSLELKVGSHVIAKRFEHSVDGFDNECRAREFAAGRNVQFTDGAVVVLEYVEKQAPAEKIEPLINFLTERSNEILNAPFHPPGRDVKPSEWNSQVRTNF
ncbi:MAG: hypothetical protein V1909_02170 [Candidatus Micrarchaeota archaeon]